MRDSGGDSAMIVWSVTTDGAGCPLHTTVHWTQAEAEARVRNDLSEDCPPPQRASLAALAGDDLMFAWNNRNGGACLIEAHEMSWPEAEAENLRLRAALEKSVKLQNHYAELLNMHDGGKRMRFSSAAAWLERLKEIEK